jgi:hypothetical protein
MAAFLFRLRGDDPGEEVILSPDTIVLDGAEVAAISAVGESSVSFSSLPGELAGLAPGKILNAGINASTPSGLLRRVTAVTPAGAGAVATTEVASLDEALEQGTIDESFALDAGTAQVASSPAGGPMLPGGSPTAGAAYTMPFDVTVGAGPASLNGAGSVSVGADLDLDVDIDKFPFPKLKSAAVTAELSGAVQVDLTATAEGEWDETVELGEIGFGTYQVPVGPLIVVVTPEIDFELALEAEAKGSVTMGSDQSAAVSASVHYDESNGWGTTQGVTNPPPTLRGPTLDAEASAKATLKPIVSLEFYGTADIGAAVSPYVQLEADECDAAINAGLDLSFEAEAEFFGKDLFEPKTFGPFNLYDLELYNQPIPGAPTHCEGWIGTIDVSRSHDWTGCEGWCTSSDSMAASIEVLGLMPNGLHAAEILEAEGTAQESSSSTHPEVPFYTCFSDYEMTFMGPSADPAAEAVELSDGVDGVHFGPPNLPLLTTVTWTGHADLCGQGAGSVNRTWLQFINFASNSSWRELAVTPLVDVDPDPDRLVGTTTWTLANPPWADPGFSEGYTSYTYEVTYDLTRQ